SSSSISRSHGSAQFAANSDNFQRPTSNLQTALRPWELGVGGWKSIIDGLADEKRARPCGLMQLDLTRYRKSEEHFSRSFKPEEVAQEGDAYRIVAPVLLDFDIQKDKEKFRLVGTAQNELELTCSRCLEGFRLPVNAAFDLRFLPAAEMADDDEREVQ